MNKKGGNGKEERREKGMDGWMEGGSNGGEEKVGIRMGGTKRRGHHGEREEVKYEDKEGGIPEGRGK